MIVDLVLNIDGLILNDGESVDDFVNSVQEITNSNYNITYDVLYCEED